MTVQETTPPCVWCGASRDGHSLFIRGASWWTAGGEPLCEPCWEQEYGEAFRANERRIREMVRD